jgi:hypothetical protein
LSGLVGNCKECNGEALGELCSFCSGNRQRQPRTYLTADEYASRLSEAARAAQRLIGKLIDDTEGPGQAVFTCLMIAYGILHTTPELPPLEWYIARLLEMPKPGMH